MTRYRHDIEAAHRRLAAHEHHTIQTPYGSVQYAEHGQGPPLLFSQPLGAASTSASDVPRPGSATPSG